MAQSLETLRRSLLTHLFGRRLGLTKDDLLAGAKDIQKAVLDISTTVPNTAVPAYGLTRVMTGGSSQGPTQHNLEAPIPGVEVQLLLTSTSTGSAQFGSTANGASIVNASAGTTVGWVNLLGPGGSITLIGLSTSQFGVKCMYDQSSTAGVRNISHTTST